MPSRPALPLAVYRNGVLTTDLEVIDMQESAGIERLDTAHLLYKDRNFEGREFHSQAIMGEEIEIIRTDTEEVLHWGKTQVVPAQINPQGENLVIVSRMEKFHLGDRVNGIWVWNPLQPSTGGDDPIGGPELIDHELIFNPIIDGRVYGNLNDTYMFDPIDGSDPIADDALDESIDFTRLFLNPESIRTTAAQSLHGALTVNWPLSLCIHYLLTTLNSDETCVRNPTYLDIKNACDDADDIVLNAIVPLGTYLAEALDLLLEPLGYRWKVDRTEIGARKFAFYRRDEGTVVQLRHQALGSTLDTNLTNVEATAVTFDVANLFNQITIMGGYNAYEVTVELLRGWPESQDNLEQSQCAKTAENFASNKNAFRKWVLNEAGDYIGLRPEIDGVLTSDFRTALEAEFGASVWEQFVPRRRGFAPTLTVKSEDASPIGPHEGVELEYYNVKYDSEHPDREPEWKPIGNWGVRMLDHECGIYFDGELPPMEKELGFEGTTTRNNIRIRATFTFVSDKRLTGDAAKQMDSPQVDVAPLVIDAPMKFRHQEVSPLSKYHNSGRPSLEAIDNVAIADFAVRVRETWDLMDVGGAIQLEGLDANDNGTDYAIGQRVSGILGKGLSFEAKTDTEEYPQIVAIERNVMNQTMTLHLQRLKRMISFGGDVVKNDRLGRQGRRRT